MTRMFQDVPRRLVYKNVYKIGVEMHTIPRRVELIALLVAVVLAVLILWVVPGPKGETDTTPNTKVSK